MLYFGDITGPEPNPAEDPDVLNILSPLDDHVREQNGHRLPFDVQMLLMPLWTIRSSFLDLALPLQHVVARYLTLRHVMVGIDSSINKRSAPPQDVHYVFDEIMNLYNAYADYTVKLMGVRKELKRQLRLFCLNSDAIWANIEHLAATDEPAFKIYAFNVTFSMQEYTKLEARFNEAMENGESIMQSALSYLAQILTLVPDIIASSVELTGISKLKLGH